MIDVVEEAEKDLNSGCNSIHKDSIRYIAHERPLSLADAKKRARQDFSRALQQLVLASFSVESDGPFRCMTRAIESLVWQKVHR